MKPPFWRAGESPSFRIFSTRSTYAPLVPVPKILPEKGSDSAQIHHCDVGVWGFGKLTEDTAASSVCTGEQCTDRLQESDLNCKSRLGVLTSLTRATHLTCRCLRSNASCNSWTTSLPIAFFAEKPFVQVKTLPRLRAVCSTGKLNVSPRGTAVCSSDSEGEAKGLACSVDGLDGTADAY